MAATCRSALARDRCSQDREAPAGGMARPQAGSYFTVTVIFCEATLGLNGTCK
jgi:hypothetical protein